jgi:predicted NUDIX family NTP pyrophosphohydrolase
MKRISAGILMFRRANRHAIELLLVHPGGPIWAKKDLGSWSIPKGEIDKNEDLQAAALREFEEELGSHPEGELIPLGEIIQASGKIVHAWALEGDLDTTKIRSNTFKMLWPPRSKTMQEFPEVDRAEFFSPAAAREKVNPAQVAFIDRLEQFLSGASQPLR